MPANASSRPLLTQCRRGENNFPPNKVGTEGGVKPIYKRYSRKSHTPNHLLRLRSAQAF